MARKAVKGIVTFKGPEISRQKAEMALPILVRQAQAGQKITYGDLAKELESPTPRLGHPLGIIWKTLKELSKKWKEEIPYINALVVNQLTGLPGQGINALMQRRYKNGSPMARKEFLKDLYYEISHYKNWPRVLKELGLEPADSTAVAFKEPVRKSKRRGGGGGGEGPEHKKLRGRIARHHELVNLTGVYDVEQEHEFPSQDKIDVYFSNNKKVVGVEVKSHISDTDDIRRGLFQCKKYEALIEAEDKVNGKIRYIKVILALEDVFPKELLSDKNTLSVDVIDNIGKKRIRGV